MWMEAAGRIAVAGLGTSCIKHQRQKPGPHRRRGGAFGGHTSRCQAEVSIHMLMSHDVFRMDGCISYKC